MRVIFIDIDGCMNTPRTWGKRPFNRAMEPELVARLQKLVQETGASLVLSSTWRMGPGRATVALIMEELGWANARCAFIGETPIMHQPRPIEIKAWLEDHGQDVKEYVVIDDDTGGDDLSEFGARYIHVDYETGLSDADTLKAAEVLCGA